MGRYDYFLKGSWNAICDICGLKYKAGDLKRQWNGLMTCCDCWEARNAQEFIKAIPETPIPWSRPEPNPFPLPALFPYRFNNGSFLDQTFLG